MRRTVFMLSVAAMLLAGCIHKITPETVEQGIIPGKTTKQEIREIFGSPYMRYKTPGMRITSGNKEVVLHKGGETWLYYVHYLGMLDIVEQETLRILFDDKGVVSSFAITTAEPTAPPQ